MLNNNGNTSTRSSTGGGRSFLGVNTSLNTISTPSLARRSNGLYTQAGIANMANVQQTYNATAPKKPLPDIQTVDVGPSFDQQMRDKAWSEAVPTLGPILKDATTPSTDPNTSGVGGDSGSSWASKVPWGAISSATTGIAQMAGMKVDSDSTYNMEQGVGDALISSGNPYAAAAGAVVKLNSMLSQATDSNVNTLNDRQVKAIGGNGFTKALNNIGGFISNTGLLGPGANFLAKLIPKTTSAYKTGEVNELAGAFSGTNYDIDTAQTMGNKRYLVGGNDADKFVREQNRKTDIITALGLDTKERVSSVPATSSMLEKQEIAKRSGLSSQRMILSKDGSKLLSKEELQKIYNSKPNVQSFGEGGTIGVDVNVIPEGALHAHKNNLEEINPELDEVTEKGIPVIITNDSGEYKQVAEIEKEELIFTKELTEKIEKLWKDGSDESILEAGRLLTKQLMENTQDNTEEILDGND